MTSAEHKKLYETVPEMIDIGKRLGLTRAECAEVLTPFIRALNEVAAPYRTYPQVAIAETDGARMVIPSRQL